MQSTHVLDHEEKENTGSLTAMCLLIIATFCVGVALYFLRSILVPFAIAIFLTHLLQPVVNILSRPPRRWCNKCAKINGEFCCEGLSSISRSRRYTKIPEEMNSDAVPTSNVDDFRHRQHTLSTDFDPVDALRQKRCLDYPIIPRWMAVIVAIILAACVMVLIVAVVYGSVKNLETQYNRYEDGAIEFSNKLKQFCTRLGYSFDSDFIPWIFQTVKDYTPYALKFVLECVAYGIYIFIFLMFLLISPSKPIPMSVWSAIDLHIRRYIRLKTAICLLVGVLTGTVLWSLNVQLSWVFGLVAFLFNFLPNLGPMAATCLPIPLILFDPDISSLNKLLAFVLPAAMHAVVGALIEPKVFGESFNLSPVVVLLNLSFWSLLWALPGAILSVPLLACARIICVHLDHPFAQLAVAVMEGRIFEISLNSRTSVRRMYSWEGVKSGSFFDNDRFESLHQERKA